MSKAKVESKPKAKAKNIVGRPTKWTKILENKALDYIDNYEEEKYGHSIPTIAGLAVLLNITRVTLHVWAKEQRGDFSYILERLMAMQETTLINRGLASEFQPTITKLMLTKHGYSDKSEVTNPNTPANDMTPAERVARIQALLSIAEERRKKAEKICE